MKLKEYFELYSSSHVGLSNEQVEINKKEFGVNVVETKKRESFAHIVLVQLGSFFSIVLISAATILFLLGETIEFYVIVFIVTVNVLIESIQRYRSDSIFESITKTIPSYAIVVRNQKTKKIQSSDIVVGDIVVLNMGDKVPADGLIIDDENLMLDEAILTGESKPVHKKSAKEFSIESVIDNPHMVFSGTVVTTGSAHILVTQVGNQTQLGMIAQKISTMDTQLPIYKNIKKLSHTLFFIIITLATITFAIGVSHMSSWVEVFKVVVALCVSAIPESLPVTITLILAYGFKRMGDKNVLVKKMQSLDVLGQIQTLALDKTGTITRNQMKVEKVFTLNEEELYVTGDGYEPKGAMIANDTLVNLDSYQDIKDLVTYATLSSGGTFIFDEDKKEWILETGDPTEVALVVLGAKNNITKENNRDTYTLQKAYSFTNQTMYHYANYKKGKKNITIYTGAPEVIFKMCDHVQINEGIRTLKDTHEDIFHKKMKEYASVGYRILATCVQDGSKMIFQGMFAINDSVRLDVFESVKAVYERGIEIIMITGDHKDIAFQIATSIGLTVDMHSVMTGEDMDNLTDAQFQNIVGQKKVFSRVTPQQKLKILEALKSTGRVVAMTGDGVNDALALVKADIGIAMGTLSSESAKEAADIVLLDNKFGSIVYGIEEGKNIFANIKKTITFLLSTNFAEMFVVVIAITLALPLPLTAVGILWVNFVTDTFLAMGFAFEREKIKDQKKSTFITLRDWARIVYLGIIMTSISLFVFLTSQGVGLIHAQSMTLLVLVIMQWFNVLNIRSGNESVFTHKARFNKVFLIGWGISAGLTIFAFNSEIMRNILSIEMLTLKEVVFVTAAASFVIWFEEIRKYTRKKFILGK